MIAQCPACLSEQTERLFASRLGCAVRSNGQFLRKNAELWSCKHCNLVFKALEQVASVADYTADYAAMGNSPERDKLDFSGEQPEGRSRILLRYLKQRGFLVAGNTLLDYGCHRGAFLKQFGALGLAKHGVAGYDMSEDYRSILLDLGFDYYTPLERPPSESFDFISLIHVVEHFHTLPKDFEQLLVALKPGGHIVIQVPDLSSQLTDTYVLDHRSHFSAATLLRSMECMGLACVDEPLGLIPGELTAVFSKRATHEPSRWTDPLCDPNLVTDILYAYENNLIELKHEGRPLWVYGAGNLGALVAGYLGEQVQGVVDDNAQLHGERFHGFRIQAPSPAVLGGHQAVIAVPPVASRAVINRCVNQGISFQLPFDDAASGRAYSA